MKTILKQFDKWLVKYEFNQFVKFVQGQGEGKCKSLVKYSNVWYYNKCDESKDTVANYEINTYNGRSEIPERGKNQTTKHYFIIFFKL